MYNGLMMEVDYMQENRKDYRKKFTSPGVIFLAGEILEFDSYNVSVQGIQILLEPGEFISSVDDVRHLLKETQQTEVFVQDLGLSAEAKIAWALNDEGKILLGLEFIEVRHNAEKLWFKRRFYRKNLTLDAKFLLSKQEFKAKTVDVSTDGMKLKCAVVVENLKVGDVIKLFVEEKEIKALAAVIWIDTETSTTEFGVRYMPVV